MISSNSKLIQSRCNGQFLVLALASVQDDWVTSLRRLSCIDSRDLASRFIVCNVYIIEASCCEALCD